MIPAAVGQALGKRAVYGEGSWVICHCGDAGWISGQALNGFNAADVHGARLVREGGAVPVSLQRALEGDPRHNVRVRPGDHLYVPFARGRTITVLGAVGAPGVFAFRRGIRLTEVLARAGGLNERGDRTDVHVVRGSLREPQAYRASLRAMYDPTGDRGRVDVGGSR